MRNHLLLLGVIVSFLIIGCATTQPEQKVERTKKVDIDTVISQLSQQISSTMLEQNKRRVAVMNFTLQTGEMTELGLYLSDKLTNSLFRYRDKFEVVERTRLESVLREMKLGLTGIIDDKTVQSIGKVLGADAIVIGSITDLGGEVDINIRMLGTERANVLAVASAFLEKSSAIIKLMGSVKTTEPGTTTTKPSQPQPKAVSKVVVNDFTFEARECKMQGQKVICIVAVVNNAQKVRGLNVYIGQGHSILVDDLGNQYNSAAGWFGGKGGEGLGAVGHDVTPGLPMNLVIEYRDVVTTARHVNVVVDFSPPWSGVNFKAVLRNIPLSK